MSQLCTVARSSFVAQRRAFSLGRFHLPGAANEPLLNYSPGSPERATLLREIERVKNEVIEIPCVVGGKEIFTGNVSEQVMPSNHGHVIARFHQADKALVGDAIKAAAAAKKDWANMPFEHRAQIFNRAADLISTKYRGRISAVTMMGVGKTVWQAEIDAAVETIDFLRLNSLFAEQIYDIQPPLNEKHVWNRSEYRPLEGFVLSVAPFNFLAIGANLACAPALMGNTIVHKPSSTAVLGNWVVYEILKEAGLPDGVINFLPGEGETIGSAMDSPDFAGLHFTGSTGTFNKLWSHIGNSLPKYKAYPRIVGETGGKNFHFVHKSANVENVINNTIRGAFEFQGQKCSATSRLYAPQCLWPEIKTGIVDGLKEIKVGQPDEMDAFMTAVIDQKSFNNIKSYIDHAKASSECEIIAGGEYDDSKGFFVQPTVIVTTNPNYKSMKEEIFGPVLTVYVYDEAKTNETLEILDQTSPYALTGAIFANDRQFITHASEALRDAAGNFYINDKSTGAVVGQQPFGGSRGSGTNDKAGSMLNLLRWVNPRSIKENGSFLTDYKYPYMEKE